MFLLGASEWERFISWASSLPGGVQGFLLVAVPALPAVVLIFGWDWARKRGRDWEACGTAYLFLVSFALIGWCFGFVAALEKGRTFVAAIGVGFALVWALAPLILAGCKSFFAGAGDYGALQYVRVVGVGEAVVSLGLVAFSFANGSFSSPDHVPVWCSLIELSGISCTWCETVCAVASGGLGIYAALPDLS